MRARHGRLGGTVAAALACALVLAACGSVGETVGPSLKVGSIRDLAVSPIPEAQAPTTTVDASPAVVRLQPTPGTVNVRPDAPLTVEVEGGSLVRVSLLGPDGQPVESAVTGSVVKPVRPLSFGQQYHLEATAVNATGDQTTAAAPFTVMAPPAAPVETTIFPYDGDVVGIGMPVIVWFSQSIPPEARASVTERLKVTSTPAVEGAWRWTGPDTLHWRPRVFWPAGTTVRVESTLSNASAGGDSWFGEVGSRQFSIGQAKRLVIDAATFQMTAFVNDQPVRAMPISAGQERYPTASGVDLIMEKYDVFEMDSASVGIYGDEAYQVTVTHAQRITNSGTFIHAAPWNSSLGEANLSHGCINASTEDAAWTLDFTQIGDPVHILNTPEQVSHDNGWGDWNLPYEAWSAPSA